MMQIFFIAVGTCIAIGLVVIAVLLLYVVKYLCAIAEALEVKPSPFMPLKVRNIFALGPRAMRRKQNPDRTYI